MNSITGLWDRLDPKVRRVIAITGVVLSALLFFTVIALMVPEPRKFNDRKTVVKHLLTDSDPRSLGIEGLATQLKQVIQKNEELLRRLSSLEDQQKLAKQADEERLRKLGEAQADRTQGQLDAIKGQLETLQRDQSKPHAPPNPASSNPLSSSPSSSHGPDSIDLNHLFNKASPAPLYGTPAQSQPPGRTSPEIRVIRNNVGQHESGKPEQTAGLDSTAMPADGSEVFIPAGTLLSGNLLNGLDAPTGKKARKEPFPVLARIKQEAILPNRFRADLRECFLIAAGYGDLSAERAYLRSETLSCVRSDGGVIEVPIDAYAVGEDGKLGLRGSVVDKQGQLLANSLLAGFAKGFSAAFGRVQIPMLMTGSAGTLGSTLPFQNAFSEQSMQGGALKGAGYSMDRVAHYYMDLAENLFPVIEIDATRHIEFVVQRGTLLKLHPKKDANPDQLSNRRQR